MCMCVQQLAVAAATLHQIPRGAQGLHGERVIAAPRVPADLADCFCWPGASAAASRAGTFAG